MIPCLQRPLDGLSLFAATADQRALLGEELYLRTHLPQALLRYRLGQRPEAWTEEALLSRLLQSHGVPRGNRLFLLTGAAGSGKSELLRWLEYRIQRLAPDRYRTLVRVPRTALDPVLIVDTILRHFGAGGLGERIAHWEALKRKPVALANQLVWGALGDLLGDDGAIIPFSYKLRPIVERNLVAAVNCLAAPDKATGPLELLTAEQLESVLSETALETAPSYEQLLARLRRELDEALLGDVRLVESLRTLSKAALESFGTRPILLIDDLVQSLNIYASELLDYFLTLEEGDWDVVIGLTPASFEGSSRTRELLQRIDHLDTIDDRVTRLYLSSGRSHDSTFLDANRAEQFALLYLSEFKRLQGIGCDETCPGHDTCLGLQFGQRSDTLLSPFSPATIRRLFRRLPDGKGKPRYLLKELAELLQAAGLGTASWLNELKARALRDQFAESPHAGLKTLVEVNGPDVQGQLMVPPTVTRLITGQATTIAVTLQPLTPTSHSDRELPVAHGSSPAAGDDTINPSAEAVRDWLEGRPVTGEQLKPLRLAAARLLKDLVDPTRMSGRPGAQTPGAIRWTRQKHECDLPLAFEGLPEESGIQIPRTIGLAAFHLLQYPGALGRARESILTELLSQQTVHLLLYAAQVWRDKQVEELTATLGVGLPDLAHHLFAVVSALSPCSGADFRPAYLPPFVAVETDRPHHFSAQERRVVEALWQDCFQIRDNLHSATALRPYAVLPLDASVDLLCGLAVGAVASELTLGTLRLREFLLSVQERLHAFQVSGVTDAMQEELTTFLAARRVRAALTHPDQLAAIRRQVYQINQLRRRLPLGFQTQIPDLAPPHLDPLPQPHELEESARTLIADSSATGPFAACHIWSHARAALSSGADQIAFDWSRRLSAADGLIATLAGEGGAPSLSGDAYEVLRRITRGLRRFRPLAEDDSRGQIRRNWQTRLEMAEILLPPRTVVNARYRPTLRELQHRRNQPNWVRLEALLSRLVCFWRLCLVAAEATGASANEDSIIGSFINAVECGGEAPDTATMQTLLAELLRRLRFVYADHEQQPPFLRRLIKGETTFRLGDLSEVELTELRQAYSRAADQLVITVESTCSSMSRG